MLLRKSYTLFFVLFVYSNTYANINANNGLYIGGNATIANYNPPAGASIGTALSSSLYFRPYIGYRFTNYLSIEAGYNNIENNKNNATDYWGKDYYRLTTFDVSTKLIVPFNNGFSIFGKIGAAYTHQEVYNKIFINDQYPLVDQNNTVFQPLMGIGISYNFTHNIATELSVTHLIPKNNVSSINILGLGLSYTFSLIS